MLSWIDGRFGAELSVRDRGLTYGDGLFETLMVHNSRPRLLERHLTRLSEGCRRLEIPLDMALVRRELLDFAVQLGDGVTKLILTRGEGRRGYALPTEVLPRRILTGSPAPHYSQANWQDGVRLFACQTRLAEQPLLAGLKHLNRLEQVLARTEWSDGAYAEGLMLDQSGRVIEGVFSNLLLVSGGVLIAPALTRCGVLGVMRAELLERASRLGVTVAIRDVSLAELVAADEVLLCNSLFGIWPVRALEEHVWPVGELTCRLQDQLRGYLDFWP